ncbi:MAG: hypothetical protein KC503_19845 [Myxococcales bacterium]|nr:hypothetical protein [Myxococcales bacterium]
MAKKQLDDDGLHDALRGLGLTNYEVRVYLAILRHPHSRIPELARHSGVPQPKVYGTVDRLIERGLCQSHLGAVNQYSAIAPDDAFLPLVAQLDARRRAATRAVEELARRHSDAEEGLTQREGRVKLFKGRPAAGRAFNALIERVQRTLDIVAQFPPVSTDYVELVNDALGRDVQVRFLFELPADADPAAYPLIGELTATGLEARRTARVPMRLGIFDGVITALPMYERAESSGDGFTMLEVRNAGLSAGLTTVFEMLWEGAREL